MENTISSIDHKNLFSLFQNVHTITINSEPKGGKLTFFLYLLTHLYKEKAVFFTPLENYLFQKKLKVISEQFPNFKNINDLLDIFYMRKDFSSMKQKYGYNFILQEIEKIISNANIELFVIHRINEFFDFQDRFEIPTFYKELVRLAQKYNKKLIIIANTAHSNHNQIISLSQELSDIIIDITKDSKNHRIINVLDSLRHQEYPQLCFKIQNSTCILEYLEQEQVTLKTEKNILLVELDHIQEHIKEVLEYILNQPGFNIKHADTLQEILKEIFIRPDLIIIMMNRTNENLQIIESLKSQLNNTKIITIINQTFVRSEDEHEFLSHGCESVLSKEFTFDEIILTLQKSLDSLFYTSLLEKLPKHNNILQDINEMQILAKECIENSIYFTSIVMKNKNDTKLEKSGRKTDYVCSTKDKVCYLAINTLPKETKHIAKKYNLEIECIAEAINYKSIEDCLK